MSFKYLGDKSWRDVTRDERYFCAELFFCSRNNPLALVNLINKKLGAKLPEFEQWEIGYEVCLYRDLLFSKNISIRNTEIEVNCKTPSDETIKHTRFPSKRTFDLTLFSRSHLVIIEAKVFQGFETKQLEEFSADKDLIKELLKNNDVNVSLIGLNCSTYQPKRSTMKYFDFERNLTWKDISELYPENPVFIRADELKTIK